MNCFQIIRSVLDEAYEQIPGDEAKKDTAINKELKSLRDNYSQLLEQNKICYSNPITRFAYIYAYVTSHANLVCTIIEKYDILNNLLDSERVNVACIGGGPGSDFLGIIKYLMVTVQGG